MYLGQGNGAFSSRTAYTTGNSATAVTVADLNGDSNLDIVTADANGASVLLGNGNGSFKARVAYATSSASPQSVVTGDFNGDGFLDLATANVLGAGNQGGTSILLGNGDGTFNAYTSYFDVSGPVDNWAFTGDFNGDGVLDLGSTNSGPSASIGIRLGSKTSGVAPLLDFSLKTSANARQALSIFDRKVEQLALQRGTIGTFQARLQVATSTLQSQRENVLAARGRIVDADVAEESSNLVRLNILQSAASSVLAQVNLQPQIALQLLK